MSRGLGLPRAVSGVSLAAFVGAGVPSRARAGMISTQEALAAQAAPDRLVDLGKVQAMLARADVRDRLQALGVDPAGAPAPAAALPGAALAPLAKPPDKPPVVRRPRLPAPS